MNVELIVRRPSGSALVEDYVAGRGAARSFFPWEWTEPEAYRARADEGARHVGRDVRERAAAMIRAPSDEARDRLERWVQEDGFLVTTGQQPGLFTGPLYSVYKGLAAVRLARQLEQRLDAPVLPVFWVASEDHDWEEAHDTWVIGVDNDLHHLEVAPASRADRDRPLHQVGVEPGEALDALLSHLPDTDFSPRWVEILKECWGGGRTHLPEAFRCTLEALLGPRGLFFLDAHDPELKAASAPVLRRELQGANEHEVVLADRTRRLEAEGYHVQVPILEGGVNLFVEGPAGRERLYRDGGSFHLRHSGTRLSAEEVEAAMEQTRSTVSPNVLLRPVVEAAVLPTVAYVAGPGELAYFAQLAPLFEAHGVPMPVVVPRLSVTVVERKIRKVLDKFGLPPEALDRPFHELAGEIAREDLPDPVREALGRLKGAIAEGTSTLTDAVRGIDPTLEGPVSHVRSVAFDAVGEAEAKIVQALKRENEIALQQLEKARLHLYPRGEAQERVLNVFYYLVRYGEGFLDALLDRLEPLPSSEREA